METRYGCARSQQTVDPDSNDGARNRFGDSRHSPWEAAIRAVKSRGRWPPLSSVAVNATKPAFQVCTRTLEFSLYSPSAWKAW
jgi:hypothetical protein